MSDQPAGTHKCYIVADKVCKSFGAHQVLKDVSTSFNTGEVTVYGATGSGRTQTYSVRGGQGSYGSLTIVN